MIIAVTLDRSPEMIAIGVYDEGAEYPGNVMRPDEARERLAAEDVSQVREIVVDGSAIVQPGNSTSIGYILSLGSFARQRKIKLSIIANKGLMAALEITRLDRVFEVRLAPEKSKT